VSRTSRRLRFATSLTLLASVILAPSAFGLQAHPGVEKNAFIQIEGTTCPEPTFVGTRELVESGSDSGHSVQYDLWQATNGRVTAEERVPQDSWRPANATETELRFFGVPVRPDEDSEIQSWLDNWDKHFRGFTPVALCVPMAGRSTLEQEAPGKQTSLASDASVPCSNGTYTNWTGGIRCADDGKFITKIYATTKWIQTAPCPAVSSAFTNWVGMGGRAGDPGPGLIQNGFWADHSPGNSGVTFMFWEVMGGGVDSGLTPVAYPGGAYNEGDTFNISSEVTTGSAMQFGWHDYQTGNVASVYVPTVGGHSALYFHDGRYAEAIDERPTIGSYAVQLRNYSVDYWSNATVTQNYSNPPIAIRAGSHASISLSFMTSSASPGPPDADPKKFSTVFHHC
jgi:hypothetical protein